MRVSLFFSFILFAFTAHAETNGAFTGYEKIVETAFPTAELNRNYLKPSENESRALENVRGTLIQLVQTIRPQWLATLNAGTSVSESDQRAVVEILKASPIYICEKKCSCSNGGPNGCAKGRPVGDAIAAIFTLEPCALTAAGCVADVDRKQGTEKRLVKFFEQAFFQTAYWKLNGMKTNSPGPTRSDRERARSLFDAAVQQMSQMRASCPRKFPEWGYGFLKSTQTLVETATPQARCAQRILSSFMTRSLPDVCKNVVRADAFQKEFRENLFKNGFKVAYCDDNCAMMTCGVSAENDSRLIRFGQKKWTAIISKKLCEGQFPLHPEELIESALEWLGNGNRAERSKCAAEIYQGPRYNREKTEGKTDVGADIELIPMETH